MTDTEISDEECSEPDEESSNSDDSNVELSDANGSVIESSNEDMSSSIWKSEDYFFDRLCTARTLSFSLKNNFSITTALN